MVFEAIQDSPERRVAVKLLRDGVASSAADRLRFKRETDLLGRLRHPNIVAIHEAGVVSGCQYLVMDYIAGQPLDAFMRHAQLTIECSVQLFLKICDAVTAAHQHGVLHRDLKPRNIQVDEHGQPHVLDFGLAADADGGESSVTVTGQFIGSLAWTSPEQAAARPDMVDIRTDVYALGLILFQMLTGRLPYDVIGQPAEVLNAIQNAEPLRLKALRREISYDLEQIALKCLSKEPERRYQSVSELAADLRRFLVHEPILARGDSTWYRLAKTVRRHRRAAAVALVLVILNLGYSVALTVYYRRSVAAESRARQAADEADEAIRAFNEAHEGYIDRLSRLALAPGTAAVQREITLEAYQRLRTFLQQRPQDRRASASLAFVLHRMGELAVRVNQREEGLTYFREAAQIREALVGEQPEKLQLQADLSVNLVRIGDTFKELGDAERGREMYERALRIDEALVEADPDNAHFWDNLSWSYQRLGLLAELRGENDLAALYFRKEYEAALRCVELEPDNPVRQSTLIEAQLRTVGEFDSADKSISLTSAKVRSDAAKLRTTCIPVISNAEAAVVHADRLVEAARANAYAKAKAMASQVKELQRASEREPGNPQLVRGLLNSLGVYAYAARNGGLHDESTTAIETAIQLAEKLVEVDPDDVDNFRVLARLRAWAGASAHQDGDLQKAIVHNQAELNAARAALQLAPNDPILLLDACAAQQEDGLLLLKLNRQPEAEASINAAMAAAEDALAGGFMSPEFERYYGRILTEPQALGFRDIERGLDLMTRGVERSCPHDPLCWDELGNTAAAAGRMDVACLAYERTLLEEGPSAPTDPKLRTPGNDQD